MVVRRWEGRRGGGKNDLASRRVSVRSLIQGGKREEKAYLSFVLLKSYTTQYHDVSGEE